VRDDADQARFIVERVPENREAGTLLKHQSVLFRTSRPGGIDAAVLRRPITTDLQRDPHQLEEEDVNHFTPGD
jgi:hypothetical protein